MPSYMNVVVLALAASNVSGAMSAPVHYSREVPEQSLSRRQDLKPGAVPPGSGNLPPGYPPPGYNPQQGKPPPDHQVYPPPGYRLPPEGYPPPNYRPPPENQGVPPKSGPTKGGAPPESGPTKGGAPPGSGPTKGGAPTVSEKAMANAKGGSTWKTHALNFVMGTAATVLGLSLLKSLYDTTVPTTPAYPQGPTYHIANVHGQPQPGYQRRAVDHDKRADFLEYMSDKNRRATSHLDLLTRADLGDALKLFSRVLDELD